MDINAMRIDMKSSFQKQDLSSSPTFQPSDYTAYSRGDPKINTNPPGVFYGMGSKSLVSLGYPSKSASGKKRGLIPQEGLAKRRSDVPALGRNLQDPIGQDRPTQGLGIFSFVDRLFDWINKSIGE